MNTAHCTTSWVNYANEHSQAVHEWSSREAYDVIRLMCSKVAVWTVNNVARLIKFLKKISYLFLPFVAYDPGGKQKLDLSQNFTLYTHPFNGPLSGTTQVSRYEKGKTNLDFTEARDSEWQWHQLGHVQVCTSLQTDNHASTPTLSFLQAGCPSCRPTYSVKALKA